MEGYRTGTGGQCRGGVARGVQSWTVDDPLPHRRTPRSGHENRLRSHPMNRRTVIALIASLSFASCDREPADDSGRPFATYGPDTSVPLPPGHPPTPMAGMSRDSLIGAWSADGENFVWVIERDSILF